MNKTKMKITLFTTLVFYIFTIFSFPAMADVAQYPIDTTPTGAHSFENIDGTALPSTHALKDTDGAKDTVDLKVIRNRDNRYLKLEQTPSGTNYQARIHSRVNPDFGNIELEFDFMVEDTNGSSDATFPDRRIIMAEGFMSGLYLLNLWTDANFKNPYIQTTYKNSSGVDTSIKFTKIVYELDKWYNFKAYVNPTKGYFTVILKNEAGIEEKIVVTDAKTVSSFGALQLIRITQWAGYTNPDCEKTVVYFDNVTMKTTQDISLNSISPANGSTNVSPSSQISFTLNGDYLGLPVLKLDDTEIPSSALSINSDGSCTYTPLLPFEWGTSHTIDISAEDKAGATYNFETVSFTVMDEPQNLIEVLGFYDSEGNKLSQLKSGEITSKLRFWAKDAQDYTYVIGLYKNDNGIIKMQSINCDAFTCNSRTDKDVTITVPSDFSDCHIRVFAFDTLSNRNLFYGSSVSGNAILQ